MGSGRLLEFLFPPKCVLCGHLLERQEVDLCRKCRVETPEYQTGRKKLPNLDRWTAVWYYEGNVRVSLLRFKFRGARSYAASYGRLLAMRLLREGMADFDLITWVPVSRSRRWRRGYDQAALIARAAAAELARTPVPLLKKTRSNPPQSGITGAAARRANVLGIFRVTDPAAVAGKRILLLDDVITTGATAGECARVLLTAGAKSVNFAAVAGRRQD